jgi:hypothetical protein
MCACPAEVEAVDLGKPIAGVAEQRPPREELVEGMLAVHRVPTAQAVLVFEVGRRDDVPSDDPGRDPRRVGFERSHGGVGDSVACRLVPVRVP